ncbi:5-oxoprolinase subunit PxpA [Flavitalea flava]
MLTRSWPSGSNLQIDLNCDMGEGQPTDAEIFPFISSANIACGSHAGNTDIMRRTIELALIHQVAIGAHPSYPDRLNFGRVDMLEPGSGALRLSDLRQILLDQLSGLQEICMEFGVHIHHIKPHGALYNRASRDIELSVLICQVIREFDSGLLLYGLSGSEMEKQATANGLHFVNEVFADRAYREDGTLTPRSERNALITDPGLAVKQVLSLIREGKVVLNDEKEVFLSAETICIHGDGVAAVRFAHDIYEVLRNEGIVIRFPAGE